MKGRTHLLRRKEGALGPILVCVTVAAVLAASCNAPMSDLDLLAHIEEFERAIQDQPRDTVQSLLRVQADEFLGQRVSVKSAVVASTYTRDNTSNIYFGVGYDPDDHIFLSELDPSLHEALEDHRFWVSVVKTYPSRQLSYELPVDEPTFERLQHGAEVAFSCRIAALIRGKSVYCAPAGIVWSR